MAPIRCLSSKTCIRQRYDSRSRNNAVNKRSGSSESQTVLIKVQRVICLANIKLIDDLTGEILICRATNNTLPKSAKSSL